MLVFTAFYNFKPFYISPPTEKEMETCVCISCLNPHLILKSITVTEKKGFKPILVFD